MRELKFRAWDIKNNRYVGVHRLILDQFGAIDYADVVYNGKLYKLYPSEVIIEQYTGLKDKNGKEIYEGDVLESTWNGDKAVVVWNNVEGEWEHYADFNTYSKYGGSVVIGNIHENPELLGGK